MIVSWTISLLIMTNNGMIKTFAFAESSKTTLTAELSRSWCIKPCHCEQILKSALITQFHHTCSLIFMTTYMYWMAAYFEMNLYYMNILYLAGDTASALMAVCDTALSWSYRSRHSRRLILRPLKGLRGFQRSLGSAQTQGAVSILFTMVKYPDQRSDIRNEYLTRFVG